MATTSNLQQYVLLPRRGLRATAAPAPGVQKLFRSLASVTSPSSVITVADAPGVKMRVLDSIREDGAKLVELPPESVSALRMHQPGLRLVPIVFYRPALAPRLAVNPKAARRVALAAAARIRLTVVSAHDKTPVPGAFVVAFSDFEDRMGAQGTTNRRGEVSLALGRQRAKLERLYVYPARGFWSKLLKRLTVTSATKIELQPIDLGIADAMRHFYRTAPETAGAGVQVGVLDTGIDTGHPDLHVAGGANTVVGEDENEFGDNGLGHGTHVAGIIAGRGQPPTGVRGLAPAVTLRSYRVFGLDAHEATNYAIAKAIDRAVADDCDLINLSLGGSEPDDATAAAIEDARLQGSLVIAAAGNDSRKAVSFPAADGLAIAVSAMGRNGLFPTDATESGDMAAPYGKDKRNFVAAFSNIGPEIDLTGPGVGIISTVPGGHAPMSGTSMACPAVTGVAARLLAAQPDILEMAHDQARSDAMARRLLQAARALGFGPKFEGQGLPRVTRTRRRRNSGRRS